MNTRSSPTNDASNGASPGVKAKWDEIKHLTPLRTKLCIPPMRSMWLSRSRLVKLMDEGFGCKLTLISAPAGSGKTTLLVDWLHQKKIPVAWFSVDKRDNDPHHFLNYIIVGLQAVKAGFGKAALAMLQSPQPIHTESILINLINEVIHIQKDFSLVLDDYHFVDATPIHDMITFLLENLPGQMHIFIATRSDPPLPLLARLRSQNQMTEIRVADLSFSIDETVSLFNKSLNLPISTNDIQLLETRTEGWIAGLQLAALSLQGCSDKSGFIKAFKGDNRYVADYLLEEVLNCQPEHLRNFLLQTSILERLSGPLCDAVTQQKNGQQMLNDLEKANLFVLPLDDERCWYRYHQLFGDLLRQRLNMQQEEPVSELHRRASQWYVKNGFLNEAVDQSLAARDYKQAAQLIEKVAEIDWDRSGESQLLQWIQKLPEKQIETNPMLCIFYARELFKNGDPDGAERWLKFADKMLESPSMGDVNKAELQGRIAVIRAYVSARTGDVPNIIHFSNQALKSLPQKDLMWRSVAATTLGIGYGWAGEGDYVKAQQAFSEAIEISRAAGNIYYHIFACGCLSAVMSIRCKLKEAEGICRQALRLAEKNGLAETELAGSLYANLGMTFCEWNDLEEGMRLIKKGIELNKQGRDPVILATCRISLLRASIYRKDIPGVVRIIEELNESTRDFILPPWITNTISAFNVYMWIAGGNLNKAVQWAKEKGLSVDNKLTNLRGPEHLALAHILIAQGQVDDADQFLSRLIKNATAGDRISIMIEMRLMRVLLHKAKMDNTAAIDELKQALSIAESGGLIMIFVSKGQPVAELLEEIINVNKRDHDDAKAGFSLRYAKKILSVYKAGMPSKAKDLVDPISDRELEVLQLIAAGLSNSEIAEKLFISLNTVKTHTKNINSKLSVNSRAKAVAHARELGLL